MVYPEQAKVHILEDEAASRAYLAQVWAEAMELYREAGRQPTLKLSREMEDYLKLYQQNFMPEDTKAGLILDYLDSFTGDKVCSLQLFKEALDHPFDTPSTWDIRQINAIMNSGAAPGWVSFANPRRFAKYGRQKGWERQQTPGNEAQKIGDGFVEETEQMELPF
jgi:predicted P-loop ATPase